MNPARQHHYLFAHRMLPQLFFSDPQRFLETLRQDGERFLAFSWDHAGERLEPENRVPAEGLGCESHSLEEDIQVGLVRLPAPQAVPEAHFVAAAYRPGGPARQPLVRFFTLEFGMDMDQRPVTVFCEWAGARHMNYGPGPEAEPSAFLSAVSMLLRKSAGT